MTLATYAPRVVAHPDRYGGVRPLPPLWVVIHTSEGASGDAAAENLAAYITRPGDRVTSSGSRYGSSYHAIADTGLRIIPVVEDNRVAYSAPGSNTEGLHICIPGKASQYRSSWLSGSSREAIRSVAAYLIDTRNRYGIPTERVSVEELRARTRGYCDHAAIRDAFGRTTHYDVGPHFPWDVLAQDVRELSTIKPTPEEEPPVRIAYIRMKGQTAVYSQWSNGTKTWIPDPATLNVLRFLDRDLQVVELPDPAWMKAAGPIVGPIPPGVDGWGCPR